MASILRKMALICTAMAFLITAAGCKDNPGPMGPPVLPKRTFNYDSPDLPAHFNRSTVTSRDGMKALNPVTNAGATLGRVLFYEVALSRDNTVSCATCHIQSHGFSDPRTLSIGIGGQRTPRHSMALANARWNGRDGFLWDTSQSSLEHQAIQPIENPREMALNMIDVIPKISAIDYYPTLFKKAFGDEQVTPEKIANALSQFILSMVSYRSRFDEAIQSDYSNLSPLELDGARLFRNRRAECGTCHTTPLQLAAEPQSNGLEEILTDNGRGAITNKPEDAGLFRPPSLRNIAVRPPYMHDGRFNTLEEVVNHYSEGLQAAPNLPVILRDRSGQAPRKLNFSDYEKRALVAFLHTLTDEAFLTDEKFSNPFSTKQAL